VRLICIHHAGGNANVFRPWPRLLPGWIEVLALELPGHGCRSSEPACTSVDTLLDGMLPALQPHLDRPFAFFGHSMGALLASELCHRLVRAGGPLPVHLFVAGLGAPHLLEWGESVLHLSRAQLLRRIEELEGTPPEILQHEELLDVVLPIIRNDFVMMERYQPRTERSLPVAISAFAGTREKITPAQLAGWSEYTSVGLSQERLPGGHFFVATATAELLGLIARTLEAHGLPG
jgi:medium-chain acyl-[acyl-carrier-protein] hydrolase